MSTIAGANQLDVCAAGGDDVAHDHDGEAAPAALSPCTQLSLVIASTKNVGRAFALAVGLVGLTWVFTSCSRSAEPECTKAIERYWRSIDIHSYFSAVSLADAIKDCAALEDKSVVTCVNRARTPDEIAECSGLETLSLDRGWKRGVFCYEAEEQGRWGRCERSNRECEYYRRVANRKREKLSRCRVQERAWAVVKDRGPIKPQPSREACELVRVDLHSRGKLEQGDQCQEVGYEELLSHRHVIPGAQ